eukprot:6148399-Pleurochrysis_carterae.AAC.1
MTESRVGFQQGPGLLRVSQARRCSIRLRNRRLAVAIVASIGNTPNWPGASVKTHFAQCGCNLEEYKNKTPAEEYSQYPLCIYLKDKEGRLTYFLASVQDKNIVLPHLELQKPQATKTQFHTLICLLGEKLDNPNDEVMRIIERLCQDYAPGYASSKSLVINYQVLVLRSDERNESDLHYQDLYWLGQNLEW